MCAAPITIATSSAFMRPLVSGESRATTFSVGWFPGRGSAKESWTVALEGVIRSPGHKDEAPDRKVGGFQEKSGGVLLSHMVSHAVPLALASLTSEFGMGSGVTSPL